VGFAGVGTYCAQVGEGRPAAKLGGPGFQDVGVVGFHAFVDQAGDKALDARRLLAEPAHDPFDDGLLGHPLLLAEFVHHLLGGRTQIVTGGVSSWHGGYRTADGGDT